MDGGDGNRRDPGSATRPIVSIAAIVFGGLGIAFQQLSTGQPQSVGRWLMLAVGSLIGGAVGILATGLFDRLLAWATTGWERFRERAQARRSEEHTSELQSPVQLVCRLLLEK